MYQILWVKQLSLIVGADVYAVTIGVSAFFGGLALGSFLVGRWADRVARPLVAFPQWQAEYRDKFGADSGDLVVYNSYEDKLGILTANATTPYIVGFIDLAKIGPMVIESPAGPIAGGTGGMWQRSVSDIGETAPTRARAESTSWCRRARRHRPTRAATTSSRCR